MSSDLITVIVAGLISGFVMFMWGYRKADAAKRKDRTDKTDPE